MLLCERWRVIVVLMNWLAERVGVDAVVLLVVVVESGLALTEMERRLVRKRRVLVVVVTDMRIMIGIESVSERRMASAYLPFLSPFLDALFGTSALLWTDFDSSACTVMLLPLLMSYRSMFDCYISYLASR